MTTSLYLQHPYQREFDAEVLASSDGWSVLSQTVFYPGGGGQPHDRGHLILHGDVVAVSAIREDAAGRIWHFVGCDLAVGEAVRGIIDWPFRYALMRHHGLMHVVNAVARRQFGGIITGVQIGPDRSRIDFKLTGFSREQIPDFENRVNEVSERPGPITSSIISENEYRRRPELIGTLNVLPRSPTAPFESSRSKASTLKPVAQRTCTRQARSGGRRSRSSTTKGGTISDSIGT